MGFDIIRVEMCLTYEQFCITADIKHTYNVLISTENNYVWVCCGVICAKVTPPKVFGHLEKKIYN